MKNLSTIETTNVKELSELPVSDLADLSEQVSKLASHARELKEKLDDALNLRFMETVKSNLRSECKDTGSTKFMESGLQIVAEVPKKVTWDAEQMEDLVKRLSDETRKAIVKTTYTIEERRYANLPLEYQELFRPARTVTPGKPRFQFSIPGEE